METLAALLTNCAWNLPVTGEFPTQRPGRGALMFSLICAWINGWVNNREAGDLRRHRAHHDVTVMLSHWQINTYICTHEAVGANVTGYLLEAIYETTHILSIWMSVRVFHIKTFVLSGIIYVLFNCNISFRWTIGTREVLYCFRKGRTNVIQPTSLLSLNKTALCEEPSHLWPGTLIFSTNIMWQHPSYWCRHLADNVQTIWYLPPDTLTFSGKS